ncbi:MAG: PIN domain-containing protein [Candidatus Bathyarchaeota archaeon]|nr:PIN domain-containing protein [Candidatus Termiticorpusculum sp.]MCL1971178.1 PIN domain-containing protein [Candidatus Termiticorpusculum sp.]
MKKLKLYLDTSTIGHLIANDVPEKMADTHELWGLLQQDKYEVIISDLVFDEINRCKTEKREALLRYITLIKYSVVSITPQQEELAQKYLQHGVLSKKSLDDLTHIACSVLNNCDCVVSWNFRHFVNIKTINRVNSVNILFGFREVKIVPPSMLLEEV